MNPRLVRSRIANLVATLLEREIAVSAYGPIRQQSGAINLITWSGAASEEEVFIPGHFADLTEYRNVIKGGNYTCLLYDGAALQLSYMFRYDELVKHRLAYYPCPVELKHPGLQMGSPVDDVFEDQLVDALLLGTYPHEQSMLRFRSPLRFDFDLNAAAPRHPASHVHISVENCRWPVYGPVSVGHFVRFVFSSFYSELATSAPELFEFPLDWGDRSIADDDQRMLFFECHGAA